LSLDADGAQLFASALDDTSLRRIEDALVRAAAGPGARLYDGLDDIADLFAWDGRIGRIAAAGLGSPAVPVRFILFDKRDGMNWALGLHQDRTVAVKARREVEGFGPWSVKAGQIHVQPPQAIIDAMITLRVHLDDVDADNAPLDILLGSHLEGRLVDDAIVALAGEAEHFRCLAHRGDIWAYRTAIVHGSRAVRAVGRRRRVLQIDYSSQTLPGGLEWAVTRH
jgi:hypothetical protein